ncbi:Vesicle trafficking between the ER and Golgi [Mucor velutinosus]|uniref:Nuclear pore complex protein n=1 Tax=Mucor velutinosus TaxID=708070 RepID=A0AAN7HNH9_9FUNG|nr:Vesicle trafficking between the ER and Golgi [Mucor velutinosus]
MSTSNDLYSKFAKVVDGFGPDSAKETADHFADLTCLHDDELNHFMYYENATWRLLSLLAETKNKSKLHRLAVLKQWVSQLQIDQDLKDRIDELNDVDDEITNLFNHVGIIHNKLDRQEPPRKKRIITTEQQDDEAICKQHFEKLRSNDLTPIATLSQNVSLYYMVNGYVQYQNMALVDEGSDIIDRERRVWKKAVLHALKQEPTDRYRSALLHVLAGKSRELYDTTLCNTWEDVIWAYLNEKTEAMLDIPHANSTGEDFLTDEIAKIASSKDGIMDKDDPRILFHYILSGILSDQPQCIIHNIYSVYSGSSKQDQYNPSIYISDQPEERAQTLRFLSTFILYGRHYFGWQESADSASLLSAYSEINAGPAIARPTVIAAYAAKQPPDHQMRIFSNFLQSFDGDDEECSILIQVGKEYGLDMPQILQHTYTHLFKKATSLVANPFTAKAPEKLDLQLQGDMTENDTVFLQAIKWLTLDENMCVEAFEAVNQTIRYLLGIYKIYLIQEIFNLVTDALIQSMSVRAEQDDSLQAIFSEYDLHRCLVNGLVDYHDWEQLLKRKPADDGSLESIMRIHDWSDQVQKKTVDLSNQMSRVLRGKWLTTKESDESKHKTKASLRQLYIPELVIRYHHVLYSTIFVMPSNEEQCKELSQLITNNNEQIFHDIKKAKKMEQTIKELSKSLA